MAGDWIKLEATTPDKPEVYRLAELLDLDPDTVIGKLVRVWVWADQHLQSASETGNASVTLLYAECNAPPVASALIDRIAMLPGFANAMCKVGWFTQTKDGMQFCNFARHNGKTAKTRAITNKRVALHRSKVCANGNADGVTDCVTKALPEKRREEKRVKTKTKNPPTPDLQIANDPPAIATATAIVEPTVSPFDQFWKSYPHKTNKKLAVAAWAKLDPSPELFERILAGLARQKLSHAWLKDEGKFIPHPATWLNGNRWEDCPPETPAGRPPATSKIDRENDFILKMFGDCTDEPAQ